MISYMFHIIYIYDLIHDFSTSASPQACVGWGRPGVARASRTSTSTGRSLPDCLLCSQFKNNGKTEMWSGSEEGS